MYMMYIYNVRGFWEINYNKIGESEETNESPKLRGVKKVRSQ